MKTKILIIVMIMLTTVSFSQTTTYKGKVVDSQKNAIAYANVLATSDNEKLVSGTTTDNKGNFLITTNEKTSIRLEISFIGFETKIITPTKSNLGIIILKEKATELNDIVVVGRKNMIEQKTDRLVFNVENSVNATNGNVLELLKATPSVQVSNNSINIVGKQSVRVLINDRIVQLSGEELVNYLSSFSSDDIKSIEVITTPPAKYEAEGNGGLINIVLKKPKENLWSNQMRGSYIQMTYPAFKLGNTFNYNHNKWQILTSLDAEKGYEQYLLKSEIHYPNHIWQDTVRIKNTMDNISAKLGVDYKLNSNSEIGFFYTGFYKTPNTTTKSHTFITDTNHQLAGQIYNDGHTETNTKSNSLNFHYTQKLDTLGKSLSADLDYFNYQNLRDRVFSSKQTGNQSTFQKSNNIGNQNITNYSAKIDFSHPTNFANFSYGGKITQTKTDNEVNFFDLTNGNPALNTKKSNIFEYTENIQALYADMEKNFGKQWQVKLGLRSEFTQTEGYSKNLDIRNKRNYKKLFPTVYLNYTKNQNNIFNLSYSKRTNRPDFYQLNPFQFYINANSYIEGNPNLQPYFSNKIQLKYIFKGKFITEVFYNYEEDVSSQIPKINIQKNQQYYTFENIGNVTVYGATQTILYNPINWWNTTTMFAGYYQNTKANIDFGTDKIFNGWKFQAYTNHSFLLNREGTIQAEATFFGQTKGYEFMYQTSPIWKLDLGIKMQFLDKKLQLTAKLNDVFKSSIPTVTTYTSGVNQVYSSYYDSRYFTLGLSYKLGNQKIRVHERNLGNEDELDRTKS